MGGLTGALIGPTSRMTCFRRESTWFNTRLGALSVTQLATEFKKRGVQKALAGRGRYVLFVGRAHVAPERDRLEARLTSLCKTKRISRARCRIVFGDQIARWVNRVPAVAIRPEFGKPYPGFQTVAVWSQQQQMQNEFHLDESRQQIIDRLDCFIRSSHSGGVIRIEGPAGVGKTRVVLEALKGNGVQERRTVYCPSAEDPYAQQLMSALQGQQANAIVVLDECDYERQDVLRPYAEGAGDEVRVICVGTADVFHGVPSALEQILRVPPLPDESIKSIVSKAYPSAPLEVVEIARRLASGYVKLAMFVAGELAARPDFPLTELRKIPDIRTFLKRFVSEATQKTLQALSLLARVGWEGSLREEAQALARVVELLFNHMQDSVARLKERGVVLPRGRYPYVSPDLLAIQAAAELWDARSELITIVSDLPGPGPRRQLLFRLAAMADHPEVRKGLGRLLGDKGLLRTFAVLDVTVPQRGVSASQRGTPGGSGRHIGTNTWSSFARRPIGF